MVRPKDEMIIMSKNCGPRDKVYKHGEIIPPPNCPMCNNDMTLVLEKWEGNKIRKSIWKCMKCEKEKHIDDLRQ